MALLLILLLGLIGLHWIWTVGAGRRLATQAARYRAAGQPIELADFATVGVVHGENAVVDLRAAGQSIDRTTEVYTAFRDQREEAAIPLRPDELERLRALLAANPKALPLLESASRKPGLNWGLAFKTPVIALMLPDLTTQRDVARLAQADALVAHVDGDHARSVRRVREMMFQSRAVDHQPILVSNLVSLGIGALAADTSQQMAEDLRVGAAPTDASPQQVRELIATLLEDAPVAQARRRALLGERMMQLDMARAIASGKVTPGGAAPPAGGMVAATKFIKPMALDDGVLMTRHTTAVLEAVEKSPTWPAFQQVAPQFPVDLRENSWRHVVANVYMPSLDRFVMQHYRYQLERRTTALVLAMRLYAVDHGGALPDTLDALVPKYLPAVPADPFAPTTQPLKYLPGADPIVYSVGENGVDEGGAEQVPTAATSPFLSQPLRGSTKWDKPDVVTHYRRQPRPAPDPLEDGVDGLSGEPTTAPASEGAPAPYGNRDDASDSPTATACPASLASSRTEGAGASPPAARFARSSATSIFDLTMIVATTIVVRDG